MLHVHTGDRRAKIRCRPGVVQYCADPHAKDAVTHDMRVLVVESRIFTLCVLAYVYATQFLRRTRGFRKILKFLSDNLERVSMRTHALLAGIRALLCERKLRFIGGRPQKRTVPDRAQMLLPI